MTKTWCWPPQNASLFLCVLCLLWCTGCGYNLKQAIKDAGKPEATSRQKAVQYLSTYIAKNLKNKETTTPRLKAIQALGLVAMPKSVNTLRLVLMHETNSEMRREAVRSLGNMRARTALQEVRDALKSDRDFDVRMTAAATLGRLGDTRAQRDLILALKDPQPSVRAAAVRSLTELRAKVAVPRMVDALMDNHIDVRTAAADGLVKIKRQSLPYLLRELTFLKVTRRNRVATVLGRFGRIVWVPLFKAFAKKASQEGAKVALIAATNDSSSWDTLAQLLNNPPDALGKKAVIRMKDTGTLATIQAVFVLWSQIAAPYRLLFQKSLGKIAKQVGTEGRLALKKNAESGADLSARISAILALGHSGAAAIPILKAFLQSSNRVIVVTTIQALGFTGQAGFDVVRPFCVSKDEEYRLNATKALRYSTSEEAVNQLIKMLQDPAATIRIAALKGIVVQGDKRAIPEVRKLLNDPLNDVILTAIQSLLKLGDQKNLQLYITAIKRSPYPPASQYIRTLGELGGQQVIPLLKSLVKKYMTYWKDYRRRSKKWFRKLRRRYTKSTEQSLLTLVQQKMKGHLATQPEAICSVIESIRALTKLNQAAYRTLLESGYQSVNLYNPLKTPPKSCPWPSLTK